MPCRSAFCSEVVACASSCVAMFFLFQAEDGIRYHCVTGVQTCALPILSMVRAGQEAALVEQFGIQNDDVGPIVVDQLAGFDAAGDHRDFPTEATKVAAALGRIGRIG